MLQHKVWSEFTICMVQEIGDCMIKSGSLKSNHFFSIYEQYKFGQNPQKSLRKNSAKHRLMTMKIGSLSQTKAYMLE